MHAGKLPGMKSRLSCAVALLPLLLGGCAVQPRAPAAGGAAAVVAPAPGERAARRALELVGVPYRYGGSGPDAFDCSGLVRYVFAEQGVMLPRASEAQYAAGQPVPPDGLAAGDLVFFRIPQAHIGIFIGEGRFVHAPASGRAVGIARLDEPWFTRAFVGAARVVPPAPAAPPDAPAPSSP
jgi:cell wall-associated NlpC family hydrolase